MNNRKPRFYYLVALTAALCIAWLALPLRLPAASAKGNFTQPDSKISPLIAASNDHGSPFGYASLVEMFSPPQASLMPVFAPLKVAYGRPMPQKKLAPTAVFTVNSTADTDDGVCDAGNCTLREAINAANLSLGPDTIQFDIGTGTPTITIDVPGLGSLPVITDPVSIKGDTGGATRVELRASLAGSGFNHGLHITAGDSVVRNLIINRFGGNGILLENGGSNIVRGCFIGTDSTGTLASGNNAVGVDIRNSSNNTIGGTTTDARNVISGNGSFGISIGDNSTGNLVVGNYIGTDVTGDASVGNFLSGVVISFFAGGSPTNNTIGGTTPGARNIISGNRGGGVGISANNNIVQGNYIGTNAAGTRVLSGVGNGMIVSGNNNLIGGADAGARNLISGNQGGVTFNGPASGNLLQGNYIGTDPSGTVAIPNSFGVRINGGANNLIGGRSVGERNLISGNRQAGVLIEGSGASGNRVEGNFIGTNAAGTAALGNFLGVGIEDVSTNTIGGADIGAGNLISGNTNHGTEIIGHHASGNQVQGNFIGTNAAGTAALGNGQVGVVIAFGDNNTIGGTSPGARNIISGNNANGVEIVGSDATGNRVEGNYIGTDVTGTADLGNTPDGVVLNGTVNNTIGGTIIGQGNLISRNNGDGIEIRSGSDNLVQGNVISANDAHGINITGSGASGNHIEGNFIGTNIAGTAALGNGGDGVFIGNGAANNAISRTSSGVRNLISGNHSDGVEINHSSNNLVQGNYIGSDGSGSFALSNTSCGVNLLSAPNNLIGGTTPATRNLISGNETGVFISFDTTGTLVQGNYIGTDVTGAVDLGNTVGIEVTGANNTVGGTAAGAGNLISGNRYFGIEFISSDATGNLAQGNYIGTDATGVVGLGNGLDGVNFTGAVNNIIGGRSAAERNIISGNGGSGVRFTYYIAEGNRATGNRVEGNYIGTDVSGTADLGNTYNGVSIFAGVNNIIGGTSAGERNLISGNNAHGVEIQASATANLVEGNFIGTKADGATALGNTGSGVLITESSNAVRSNTIACNGADGVSVTSGVFNTISKNSIFANSDLGIDLKNDGITANDPCDLDTGPNNLQNSPEIISATISGGATTIQAKVNGTANTTYIIEFFSSPSCDASGSGEGATFIGSETVMTDGSCVVQFTKIIPLAVPVGSVITATATEPDKDTSEFCACRQVFNPTAVEFDAFAATGFDDAVLLEWQTGFEVDNLGFNVYRQQDGKRTLITPQLVAGSALMAGPGTSLAAGRSYAWVDNLARDEQDVLYWIEDLDLNGQSEWHGPFPISHAVVGKQMSASNRRAATLLSHLGSDETHAAQAGDAHPVPVETRAKLAKLQPALLQIQSDFAAQRAIKLSVRQQAWYRVTQQELLRAGLDPRVDPRHLQLFVDGKEQPILVVGENDGQFDPSDAVEFYGLGLDSPYTDLRAYWLVAGTESGKRIQQWRDRGEPASNTGFSYTVERRDRNIYFSSLRNGEKENFFGAVVARDPVSQSLTVAHLDHSASGEATLEIALQGVTQTAHHVEVLLNDAALGTLDFNGQAEGVAKLQLSPSLLREGENLVRLIARQGPSDVSLVDTIRLTYRHAFRADGDDLRCTAAGNQQVTIDGFSSGEIRVLDVTDSNSVQEVMGEVTRLKMGYSIVITAPGTGPRALLAFTGKQISSPLRIAANEPSNWRAPGRGADLVVITHRDFFGSLEPLKRLRESQGLSVAVIDVEDIYDEFSYGQKTPRALKDFLAYAKTNWKKAPRFVLLAADASLDPKNYLGLGDFDLVPTKLIDTAYLETASDDWFADFNADGLAEISVGRLPARTAQETARMIAKILAYERSSPAESVLLVADSNDGYDFEAASTQLRSLIPANLKVEQINRGSLDQATAKSRILEAINRGQAMINYTGHGSVDLWRGKLLTSADARGLMNGERLPLFVMMTCLNGYFQDAALESLAEALMQAEHGGAVAVWASSGMTMPYGQATMNQELYRLLLGTDGRSMTLGEATLRAKAAVSDGDVRRTWILLGDPAMRVKLW